jgi:hypothetical protein
LAALLSAPQRAAWVASGSLAAAVVAVVVVAADAAVSAVSKMHTMVVGVGGQSGLWQFVELVFAPMENKGVLLVKVFIFTFIIFNQLFTKYYGQSTELNQA